MEIYGVTGYLISKNRSDLIVRIHEDQTEKTINPAPIKYPFDDPFSMFAAVVNNEIELPKHDLSPLKNNMIVMEICQAAMESTATGTRIYLPE